MPWLPFWACRTRFGEPWSQRNSLAPKIGGHEGGRWDGWNGMSRPERKREKQKLSVSWSMKQQGTAEVLVFIGGIVLALAVWPSEHYHTLTKSAPKRTSRSHAARLVSDPRLTCPTLTGCFRSTKVEKVALQAFLTAVGEWALEPKAEMVMKISLASSASTMSVIRQREK